MGTKSVLSFYIVVTASVALVAQHVAPHAEEIKEHAERARMDLARNDLSAAEQEYRAILQIDPGNADVYTALGVALYGSGNLTEAVGALEKALKLDMSQRRAELFLSLSESDLGECDKALPILAKYFSEEPDAKLRRLVGLSLLNCQLHSADTAAALSSLQKLRQLYPDDADVLYKSAEIYTRLWNEAAGKLIQQHPESYRVHQLAGEVFDAQGNVDRAIKEFRLAVQQNSRVPEVHFRIGQLLLKQDDGQAKEHALDEFRQELIVDPSSAASENAIADIYRELKELGQAVQHYKRAIDLDPDSAQAHIGLAQVLLAQHDSESAQHELEVATRLQPESAAAHYNLMLAYRSEGKIADATREMALFQRLQQASSETFENKLHSLMKGQSVSDAAQK